VKRQSIFLTGVLQADVNVRASEGVTPLMVAASNGHASCVEALAARGADVAASTDCGVTALMLASAAGNVGCVTSLLALGADIRAVNAAGWTALRFAVHNLRPQCVAALGYRSCSALPGPNARRLPPADADGDGGYSGGY
jgi:ankyrin repeat protein